MKKAIVYILVGSMLLSFGGCKKNKEQEATNSTQVESSVPQATEAPANTPEPTAEPDTKIEISDLGELMTLVEDSSWSGVDAQGNAYLVNLAKNQIDYMVSSADGVSQYEGKYALYQAGKLLMENEELAAAVNNAEFELVLDGEDSCLKIGEVLLTKDSVTNYEEKLQELDVVALAAEYMNSGHCWLACLDMMVVVLYFDGQEVQMKYLQKDGDAIITEEIDASWSMQTENFAFYDLSGKKIEDFDWSFEDEGDLKVFTVVDEEEKEMLFYELEKDSIEAGEELAKDYLENQQTIEEVEDLSQVLAGYEGVSIVDAFVAAGLDPSFSNRAIFAEKFEIENYKGTAAQNLFLLESMGGTIK